MPCPRCRALLPDGVSVCPVCGLDRALHASLQALRAELIRAELGSTAVLQQLRGLGAQVVGLEERLLSTGAVPDEARPPETVPAPAAVEAAAREAGPAGGEFPPS